MQAATATRGESVPKLCCQATHTLETERLPSDKQHRRTNHSMSPPASDSGTWQAGQLLCAWQVDKVDKVAECCADRCGNFSATETADVGMIQAPQP